jgi:NodT family efflux transporter outer membrane factor (OMF) lipoprotein
MIFKSTALALCLLSLSACSVTTSATRDNLTAQLPQTFISVKDVQRSEALFWTESFDDPMLIRDIMILSQQNFEIDAARSRVEQAAASYGIRRADLFPKMSVSSDFERKREKEDRGSSRMNNILSFASVLSWELDVWGRLRARRKASALTVNEKKALVDELELDMQTLLVESWITRHASQKLITVIQHQQNTNAHFLELTELRFAQGQGNALNVLQQRRKLAKTKRALPSVRADVLAAENAYDVLLGQSPDGENIPLEIWPDIKPFSSLPAPASLIERRPDLRAAFLALLAKDQEVAAAIADRLPKLSIGLTYSLSGGALSNIGDSRLLSFTTGILAAIFDAGRRRIEISRRKALAKEALADLEQALLVALREVEDGLSREIALFTEKALLAEEMTVARQTLDKTKLRYMNGQENYLSILDALDNVQTLQQKEINLQRDLLINRARLLKAFGADWDNK